jgi:hypothetical protein
MGVGQATFVCIHTQDTTFQVRQSIDLPTLVFNAAEPYRNLYRVHCNDQRVQCVKFRVGLCHLFKSFKIISTDS